MKPLGVIINPAANRGRGNSVGEKALAAFQQAGIQTINLSGVSQDDAGKQERQSTDQTCSLRHGTKLFAADHTSELHQFFRSLIG